MISGPDRYHGTPGEFGVKRCQSCGLGVTTPPETAAQLVARYPGGYEAYDLPAGRAAGLASRLIRRWQARQRFRGPFAPLAELAPGRAVDVGCGRGDLGADLIARGWVVTGVEPSQAASRVAESRGLDVRTGALSDVALEADTYRVASFQHSLEHVNDPVADLRKIGEALEPGGICLISVPNWAGWQARRFGSRWYHLDLPRHRVHFTRTSLATALEHAGFEPVWLFSSTSALGLPASLQYLLAGRCLFPSGLRLRVAGLVASALYPVARLLDRAFGDGDVLHALARVPAQP